MTALTDAAAPPRDRPLTRRSARWCLSMSYWLTSYRYTWRASAISGFLAPLLYLGSLGYGLGSLIDAGGPGRVAGVAYAVFVAPGVLAANSMQTAVSESTYPVMGAVKWHRQYHAMLATPLSALDTMIGHLAFILFRVGIGAVAFLAVGGLLGAFDSWTALLTVPVTLLIGAAHAAPVMAYAAGTDNDGGFNLVFRFGVVPMFLFAGTFFPVDQLPALLRPVAWLTPLWHGTSLCRDLTLGHAHWLPSLGHAGYLAAWALAGIWAAALVFRRRLVE